MKRKIEIYLNENTKNIMLLKISSLNAIFLVLFSVNISFAQGVATDAVASCCSSKKGRCTGSANCNVCTNCSRCGYCNSGGTCGVCVGRNTNRTYNYSESQSKKNEYNYSSNSNRGRNSDAAPNYYMKTLVVTSEILNLRRGRGTSYGIIQKLIKNQELFFLEMEGEWVKVKVKSNNMIGFVHFKYVALFD